MKKIGQIANWAAAGAYVLAAKIIQLPGILAEREPRFVSDETVTPAIGNCYAIVVKYHLIGITSDFLDLLATLRRQHVNAIVVCNGDLRPDELVTLRAFAHRILVRNNIGRDFGAYRAATLHLASEELRPERMIYLNDSVIYIAGPGLDSMIKALLQSDYDAVGTYENHEFAHHMGSYAFSVAGKVFADAQIRRFWRGYRPYDIRPHAIRKGELGFSQCLERCGYRVDVIYSADKLALRLDKMSISELVATLRYVPYGALRGYDLGPLLKGAQRTGQMLAGNPKSKRRGEKRGKDSAILEQESRTPTISEFGRFSAETKARLAEAEKNASVAIQIKQETLVNHMIGTIINGSQIHFGFGLFHRVMDSPLVKRDLLIRGILLEHDCARILEHLTPPRREPIMRELLNRGRAVNVRGMRRFKLRNGLI